MIFQDLGLAEPVLKAVLSKGYETPTPIQAATIPPLLAGEDLIGCAQTGTGKTAAFALPLLTNLLESNLLKGGAPQQRRRIRCLILSPTRELAGQIGDSLTAYGRDTGIRNTVIFGGVNQFHQVRALKIGVDVLVATPGRLLDLMNQRFVDLSAVEIFVLDEADRMLDMGFLPDVRRIIAKLPSDRQTAMYSATMPAPIEDLARTLLRNPTRVTIAPKQATIDLIEQSVCMIGQAEKPALLAELISQNPQSRSIVFTRTKHGADRVVKQLRRYNISSEAIHGNKSQNSRQRTLGAFKASEISVLVATDVAARGIDIEGVTHVFNYDLPTEPETYVHRVGRTGRAGASGIAIAFCTSEDRSLLTQIERLIRRRVPVHGTVKITLPPPPASSQLPPDRERQPRRDRQPTRDRQGASASRNQRPATASARPAQGRPSQGRSSQGRPSQARPAQGQAQQRPQGEPAPNKRRKKRSRMKSNGYSMA